MPPVSAALKSTGARPKARRKPARMTPAKLRAQRANARLSTGPRTPDGSRRAALNRLRFPLDRWTRRQMKLQVRDYAELQRIWRELAAIFWFLGPAERHFSLYFAAWEWWRKLAGVRAGASEADLDRLNSHVDASLARLLSRYAHASLEWDRRLSKEMGKDALRSIAALRMAVEARLDEFRDVRTRREGRRGGSRTVPGRTSLVGEEMARKRSRANGRHLAESVISAGARLTAEGGGPPGSNSPDGSVVNRMQSYDYK